MISKKKGEADSKSCRLKVWTSTGFSPTFMYCFQDVQRRTGLLYVFVIAKVPALG